MKSYLTVARQAISRELELIPKPPRAAKARSIHTMVGRLTSAVLLFTGLISFGLPMVANGASLQCPIFNPSTFTKPLEKTWLVTSTDIVKDADGAEARTFAGFAALGDIVQRGNTTYIAYFNEKKQPTVAKRVGNGAWTWQSTDITMATTADSHASLRLEVDTNGNVHMVAQAGSWLPLNYWVTTVPGDLSTLTPERMIPTWRDSYGGHAFEDAVSYPRLYTGKNGQLFFRYQVGSQPGSAYTAAYQYNTELQTWQLRDPVTGTSGLAILFNGWHQSPPKSAYPSVPQLGPDGMYHMFWTWRGDGSGGTNSEVHYAKSEDMHLWKNVRGEVVLDSSKGKDFFVYGDVSTRVDDTPMNGGILNDNGIALGFDANNAVVLTFHKYVGVGDEKTTQLFMARPNGSSQGTGWSTVQVSNWTGLYDLENEPVNAGILSASVGARPIGSYLGIEYYCQYQNHLMYVDAKTGELVADLVLPQGGDLPGVITQRSADPRFSTYKGLLPHTAFARGSTPDRALVLKWDAGGWIVDGNVGNLPTYPEEGTPVSIVQIERANQPSAIVSGVGKCLDVDGSTQNLNGARVQTWGCNGLSQQRWKLEGRTIKSAMGKCLAVSPNDLHKGYASVHVWDCDGSPSQTWVRQGESFVNGAGLCLDVDGQTLNFNGAAIWAWACSGTLNQKWRLQ